MVLAACGNDPTHLTPAAADGPVDVAADVGPGAEVVPDAGVARDGSPPPRDAGAPDFPIVPCGEEGVACDDGRACTSGDTCRSGVCVGTARDCSALSAACAIGVCVEPSGTCGAIPRAPGTACDDGLFCTLGDSCQGFDCVGTWRDCAVLSGQCQVGVCDELGRSCVAVPSNEAGSCDDGVYCTVSDHCSRGLCEGVPRDCSALADDCNAASCDEAASSCVSATVNEGGPCEDGVFCTVGSTCAGGVCGGGVARDCSAAGNACNVGSCDEVAGACVPVPANDGWFCEDGLACTSGETCAAGACVGGLPFSCDDGDACTDESCQEPFGCVYTQLGPFPGLEGPVGDPTCSDGLDNDCDGRRDLADGNCVAGNPGVACGTDVCLAPEVCCITPPPAIGDPYCTTSCPTLWASCDEASDCPDSTCCIEVQIDPVTYEVSSGTAQCEASCPYVCDPFGGFGRSEPCGVPANCATQPSCCQAPALETGVCLDAFCAALLQSQGTGPTCQP
jgi:hypothetical protein